MIIGVLQEYEEHLASEFISDTLSDVNSDFSSQLNSLKVMSEALEGMTDKATGLAISASTFPGIIVSAGAVVTPNGTIYRYNQTILSPTPTPSTLYRIFINNEYQVEVDTTIPITARLQLGTVKYNEHGIGFAQILGTGIEEISFTDPVTDILTRVEVYNGLLPIVRVDYVYNTEDFLIQSITQTRYKTLIKDYIYDGDDLLSEIKVTKPEQQPIYLNGAILLDDTFDLSGTASELLFPLYEFNYDHERIYDGSQTYGEY